VNAKYASVERQVKVSAKEKIRLNLECDELWSFVDHKGNKQWVWLAMDRKTREIVGVYIEQKPRREQKLVEFSTSCISTMCCLLYRFWEPSACILPTRHKE